MYQKVQFYFKPSMQPQWALFFWGESKRFSTRDVNPSLPAWTKRRGAGQKKSCCKDLGHSYDKVIHLVFDMETTTIIHTNTIIHASSSSIPPQYLNCYWMYLLNTRKLSISGLSRILWCSALIKKKCSVIQCMLRMQLKHTTLHRFKEISPSIILIRVKIVR